jgi:hypothetical protein
MGVTAGCVFNLYPTLFHRVSKASGARVCQSKQVSKCLKYWWSLIFQQSTNFLLVSIILITHMNYAFSPLNIPLPELNRNMEVDRRTDLLLSSLPQILF